MCTKTFFTTFVSLLAGSALWAQTQHFQRLEFPVTVNGKLLETPFAGGLNAAQFSAADLNNDQVLDLVVFDRAGDVLLTYLNEGVAGQSSYRFAPEYACYFPLLTDYVLLRDYDKDGAADIFCGAPGANSQAVQVFKGYFENNFLKFKPFNFTYPGCTTCNPFTIYYPSVIPGFWNNLYIAKTDIPAVDDIDGDGDLDILTFDGTAGGHVWLVENMSVEMGYGLDSLKFNVTDRCWGRFYESGVVECRNCLSPNIDTCVNCTGQFALVAEDRDGSLHPGSTLMTYDQEGDGDKEIVLGDVSFSCLNMMTNGGNADVAWMVSQDTAFPSYDTPLWMHIFPAPFYLDLNNDGKKDMVVSPNHRYSNEDRLCAWYYPNIASSGHVFELQSKRFLVGDMIDLGTATHPVLVDVNADGLLDLVVGNKGFFFQGYYRARLTLFLNTGTATNPHFTLEDEDWLGMSEFTPDISDFFPAFGDLDGDGDLDLLVGNEVGDLFYYRNSAGAGKPMQLQRDFNVMWVLMDVGSYSTPIIVDLDSDGLQDVVMGERNGVLNFFKNVGASDNPVFEADPTIEKLGAVDTRIPPSDYGYSTPALIPQPNGAYILVAGADHGQLEAYNNVVASSAPYTLISEQWGNIDEGERSSPTFGDLDGDGVLEMVVGNLRGGLSLYRTVLVDCTTSTHTGKPLDADPKPRIHPNPARQWVRVEWAVTRPVQWQAFDLLGRRVAAGEAPGGTFNIPVGQWAAGMYFLELVSEDRKAGRQVLSVVR